MLIMEIKGNLSVEKWIIDSPYKIYNSENELLAGLTKIGSIGFYSTNLWYRKDISTVIPLASIEYVTNTVNNIVNNSTIINNISNSIINNITSVVINNILNSQQLIDTIINTIVRNLNVEIRSIKNRKLFFAIDPLLLPPVLPPITLPTVPQGCTPVASVNILGNMTPLKGSTHTYTLDVPNNQTVLSVYTIVGGVLNTSPYERTVQATWDLNFNGLASINVSVGCDVPSLKYDFNFFILQ